MYINYLIGLVLIFAQGLAIANDNKTVSTLNSFKNSKVGRHFIEESYAYAVFPSVGKGGFVVGAAHGDGMVFRQGQATGTISMTQLSVGFQLGAQVYSQIVFMQDETAYQRFTSNKFEFSADASAIAVNARASASVSTLGLAANKSLSPDEAAHSSLPGFHNGMAVLTVGKGGFMYEASLSGQKFIFTPAGAP